MYISFLFYNFSFFTFCFIGLLRRSFTEPKFLNLLFSCDWPTPPMSPSILITGMHHQL